MKTEFELIAYHDYLLGGTIKIIGEEPKYIPYVSISLPDNKGNLFIKDKDLERFAVNILKALKSKHLKTKSEKILIEKVLSSPKKKTKKELQNEIFDKMY